MAWSNAVGWTPRRGWNNPPAAGGGGSSFATWDPMDFTVADTFGNASVSLDATKLIATQNHTGFQAIITGTRAFSGLCHVEFIGQGNVGIEQAANKSGGYTGFMGGGTGLSYLPDGRVFLGFGVQATLGTYTATDHVYMEVDTVAKLVYFGVNSGARNSALSGAGIDISGMSGLLYPAADIGQTSGASETANFGPASSFVCPVTAGYGPIP